MSVLPIKIFLEFVSSELELSFETEELPVVIVDGFLHGVSLFGHGFDGQLIGHFSLLIALTFLFAFLILNHYILYKNIAVLAAFFSRSTPSPMLGKSSLLGGQLF